MSSTKQPSAGGNTTTATPTTTDTKVEEKSQSQGFSLEEDDEFEDFPVEGEFRRKEEGKREQGGNFLGGMDGWLKWLICVLGTTFRLGRTRYRDGRRKAKVVGGELG